MSAVLKGTPEFKRRLKAISTNVFKPAGKDWADEAVRLGHSRVSSYHMPYSKGVLVPSIRRRNATAKRATVVGSFHAYFVDKGPMPHSLQRRGKKPRTLFGKRATRGRHPGYRGRPFRDWMAHEALRRKPMSESLIRAWNEAA